MLVVDCRTLGKDEFRTINTHAMRDHSNLYGDGNHITLHAAAIRNSSPHARSAVQILARENSQNHPAITPDVVFDIGRFARQELAIPK